jgi:hypothetical protein
MGQKVRLLLFGGFAPSEAMLNLFEPHGFSWRRASTAMMFGWSHRPVDGWF